MTIDSSLTIEPAAGPLVWRVIEARLLTPAENQGKHNIFIDAFVSGVAIRNGSLLARWGWEGQRPDEFAKPAMLDKRAPDHCTDIPIEKGQHIWLVLVDNSGRPSDTVRGLRADMPGPGGGNDWHHWSWYVKFELMTSQTTPQPPTEEPLTLESMNERLKRLEAIHGL